MSYRDLYPRTIRRAYAASAQVLNLRAEKTATASYVEGRAVPYKTWADIGPYHEQIWPSCFIESLREDPNVPLLLFHDHRSFPVGVAETWRHEDDGLYGRWRMDSSETAAEATRQASLGALRFSIGFQSVDDGTDFHFEDDRTYVTRLAARLLEVSLTPTPAYAGARVTLAT